ncbi:MAG: glucose 1-dehydrogenase [Reichenbachiella sp.]|uniref:glucose 1-dehydrogenase n=1 Tax=Reichenbachiella sp. TaxID=2184521 RepID=UPI003264FA85
MSKFSLKDKVAVVTGASKGIGEAIASIYAAAGAKVVVSSRKQEAVDQVAEKINAAGFEAIGVACNTGDMQEIGNLVDNTLEAFGKIDIIVNNAATNPVFGPVLNTELSAFDKIMDVNVKGPFELAKLSVPHMESGGSIINISSVGGISPEAHLGIYSVSKAALISLTKVMAKELGAQGIRANVICPGLIKTKFSEALWTNDDLTKKFVKHLPLGRIGESDEISGLALFLASEASSYCTGGVYTADGGFTI